MIGGRGAENHLRANSDGPIPSKISPGDGSFEILHTAPSGRTERLWRACVVASDFPTHYATPEYFSEPVLRGKRPFAVLSVAGDEVTAVLTGVHDGYHVRSGLSVRPQVVFSRHADRQDAIRNLLAGLLQEAKSARLIDFFLWTDLARLVDRRFQEKQCEGVVLLDLTRGPDALFRKFSSNKKLNIKKAIKHGVSVRAAQTSDEIAAYYGVYVDWSRRKGLSVVGLDEFQANFALTNNRQLFLAASDAKIIAGAVVRFFPGGVMEYAANSSLEDALYLRPNDLLHWRAIEWACAEGMTKYSLGGTHLFLRKFGGEVKPITRWRLDQSLLRRYAAGDRVAEWAECVRPFLPERFVELGRSFRERFEKLRAR
jgi:hypothetical protein